MTQSYPILQWRCYGATYSLYRLDHEMAWLLVNGPGERLVRGRRDLPLSLVEDWRLLTDDERSRRADLELGAIVKEGSPHHHGAA